MEDERATSVILGILFCIFAILGVISMTKILVFIAAFFNGLKLYIATVLAGLATTIYASFLNRGNMKDLEKVKYDKDDNNEDA